MAVQEPFSHCGWYMYRTPFVEWGISCAWEVSYVSMFCVLPSSFCPWCVCVGCYGDVFGTVARSEAGFDELKFTELSLIHHRLFTTVRDNMMPVITSHNSPTN